MAQLAHPEHLAERIVTASDTSVNFPLTSQHGGATAFMPTDLHGAFAPSTRTLENVIS